MTVPYYAFPVSLLEDLKNLEILLRSNKKAYNAAVRFDYNCLDLVNVI